MAQDERLGAEEEGEEGFGLVRLNRVDSWRSARSFDVEVERKDAWRLVEQASTYLPKTVLKYHSGIPPSLALPLSCSISRTVSTILHISSQTPSAKSLILTTTTSIPSLGKNRILLTAVAPL